jgi:hypothetical protein
MTFWGCCTTVARSRLLENSATTLPDRLKLVSEPCPETAFLRSRGAENVAFGERGTLWGAWLQGGREYRGSVPKGKATGRERLRGRHLCGRFGQANDDGNIPTSLPPLPV